MGLCLWSRRLQHGSYLIDSSGGGGWPQPSSTAMFLIWFFPHFRYPESGNRLAQNEILGWRVGSYCSPMQPEPSWVYSLLMLYAGSHFTSPIVWVVSSWLFHSAQVLWFSRTPPPRLGGHFVVYNDCWDHSSWDLHSNCLLKGAVSPVSMSIQIGQNTPRWGHVTLDWTFNGPAMFLSDLLWTFTNSLFFLGGA